MKRLVIALSILAVLGIIFPGLPTLAQPPQTPHENPTAATGSLDSAALLLSYSRIYSLAVSGQYQNAQNILTELKQTDIPAELRYITDHYETLSRQVLDNLNNIEFLLDKASTLFSHDLITDARESLDESEELIQDTKFLLKDIEATTDILGGNLGVFTAPATGQIRQAYDRLSSSLNQVSQLADKLAQLRESLNEDPLTVITTQFYHPTSLELSAPETACPGRPFTISGQVNSTGGNIDRTMIILLDDTQLAEKTVAGQFSLEIIPPEPVATGRHNLTVSVTPQGRYAGVSETRTIEISRLPIYIDTQTPTLVIMPQPFRISGRVYHELGPVPDARVSLNFKNSSITAVTSPDGIFTLSMKAPLDLSFAGPQEIMIDVQPPEPWYTSLQVNKQLFTINPLSIELILVALLAMWILADIGIPIRRREKTGIPQPELIQVPVMTPPPESRPRLTGIKLRIISAYRGGLEAVEKISGISMTPRITLREFLKMATLLLPTNIKQFAELTSIAEITLYSDCSPHEDTATQAEHLAATIREELHRGTS